MKKIYLILFSFIFFLLLFLLLALRLVGRPTVLKHTVQITPYAQVLQTSEKTRNDKDAAAPLIIFMGDSSVAQPPWAKEDAPHMPAMLEAELRETCSDIDHIRVMDWSFLAARPFHYYCLLFEAEKHSPDLVIIPINWRIFGPYFGEWKEVAPFHELSALVPIKERFHPSGKGVLEVEGISLIGQFLELFNIFRPNLLGLRLYFRTTLGLSSTEAPKSASEPAKDVRPLAFFQAPRTAQPAKTDSRPKGPAEYYSIGISSDDDQLGIIKSIVETSSRHDIKVLFYITPIHIQELRQREDFRSTDFQESIRKISEAATSESSTCVNLAELLDENCFIDIFEHYSPEGNDKITRSLVVTVKELIDCRNPAR